MDDNLRIIGQDLGGQRRVVLFVAVVVDSVGMDRWHALRSLDMLHL